MTDTPTFEEMLKDMSLSDYMSSMILDNRMWVNGGEWEVNTNDFFWWGCADCEEVTQPDLVEFYHSYRDINAIVKDEDIATEWGPMLWVARKRSLRPQGAYYEVIPEALHELFNAAGPEREITMMNPKPISPGRSRT